MNDTGSRGTDARGLQVAVISRPEALDELKPEWDALLEQSAANSIFLTWTWISTWWQVFGGPHRLQVLSVRSAEGALVGLAPCMVQTGVEGFPKRLRVLMLIGQQGDTLAEQLDVIAAPDAEASVVEALSNHLLAQQRELFDLIYLERVRADSPTLVALEAALTRRGYPYQQRGRQQSPYLPLPPTWEELRASKSRNFRRQLKSSQNRLAREGHVSLVVVDEESAREAAFETLIELHRARWGPDDGSFETEAYLDFHRRLSRRLLAEQRLMLALLRVGDEVVAARYDFLYDDRIWCFQGGWRPGYERMRVGTILTAEVIQWGLEAGYREYDFLSGEDGYKQRWATEERTLVDLVVWGRGARAWRHRQVRRFKDALKRILRRGG